MQQPTGKSSFNWMADVAAGTSFIFFMVDAQGHQGGSSNIMKVESSNDASCLGSSSPSSTRKSSTHTSSTSTPSTTGPSNSNNGITTAGSVGIAIGIILFLAIVTTMALFIRRRKQNAEAGFKRHQMDLTAGSYPGPSIIPAAYTPSASANTIQSTSQYNINPFESTASVPLYQSPIDGYQAHPRPDMRLFPPRPSSDTNGPLSNPHSPTFAPANTSAGASSPFRVESERSVDDRRRAKAIAAGIQPPPRFIVHTDAEDEVPRPDESGESGVVEVPPRYTMRFAQNAPPAATDAATDDLPTELPYR